MLKKHILFKMGEYCPNFTKMSKKRSFLIKTDQNKSFFVAFYRIIAEISKNQTQK